MKPLLRFVLFCLFAVLIVSCSNPMNRPYNEKTLTADLKAIVQNNKADTSKVGVMVLYMMRAKMLGQQLEGQTYQDILDSAKALKKTSR